MSEEPPGSGIGFFVWNEWNNVQISSMIVAILPIEPKVLLLDEPFGALDALTRASLQDELNEIVNDIKTTVVMVTHDVDEAILPADRVVMMTNGPAATIGESARSACPSPETCWRLPISRATSPPSATCWHSCNASIPLTLELARHVHASHT